MECNYRVANSGSCKKITSVNYYSLLVTLYHNEMADLCNCESALIFKEEIPLGFSMCTLQVHRTKYSDK